VGDKLIVEADGWWLGSNVGPGSDPSGITSEPLTCIAVDKKSGTKYCGFECSTPPGTFKIGAVFFCPPRACPAFASKVLATSRGDAIRR